jgi:hypothetical protein
VRAFYSPWEWFGLMFRPMNFWPLLKRNEMLGWQLNSLHADKVLLTVCNPAAHDSWSEPAIPLTIGF